MPVRPIVAVAVAIAAAVALATISSRVTDIVGLVAFSLVLTWLTRPLFRRVQRRLGEGAAIALTTVIILAGAGVLLGLLLSDLTATRQRRRDRHRVRPPVATRRARARVGAAQRHRSASRFPTFAASASSRCCGRRCSARPASPWGCRRPC